MPLLWQVPLFWHGCSISHGVLEILQFEPIDAGVEQVGGDKKEPVDCWTKMRRIPYLNCTNFS